MGAFDEFAPETPLVLAVFKYAMNRFESKHLDLSLQSMKILGENQAEEFIEKNENLLEDLYNDPEVSLVVEQIDSITIENNSIIVKPRRSDASGPQLQYDSDTDPDTEPDTE